MIDLDAHLPAIAAGDADAFAAWLAGAELPVRRSLRSFAQVVDTEAVLQEALLRVWQVAPRVTTDGRPNALLRFATRVARNAAIDEVRRRREVLDDDGTPPEDIVQPVLPDPALREHIERCRDKLPPRPAQAWIARLEARGGIDDRGLAEELGMRLNTFLKNVGRARALLQACLQAAGIEWRPHGS
ncbi:MAG: sigma-70 family RNA polymerase sigma factor [Myxococcota bacterium]